MSWLYNNIIFKLVWFILKPVFNVVHGLQKFIHNVLVRLATRNNEDNLYNTGKKGLAFVCSLVITGLLLIWFVFRFVPFTTGFTYDAIAMSFSSTEQQAVFGRPQPIEGTEDRFRVFACFEEPCRAQIDSIEFRIRDSAWMDSVYLVQHGIPYDTSELAGAFLGEKNLCTFTTFGHRRKFLNMYPKIIDAQCVSVDQQSGPRL